MSCSAITAGLVGLCLVTGTPHAAMVATRNDLDILEGFVYGMGAAWSFVYHEETFNDKERTFYKKILYRILSQGRRDASTAQAHVITPPGTTNASGAPLGIVGASASNNAVTIVGYQDAGSSTPYHAFRYSVADGYNDLGTLGSADEFSFAADCTLSGAVITGASTINQLATYKAFIWTPTGGMVDLDPQSSTYSVGLGISADGSTVIGQRDTPQGRRGFLWNAMNGFTVLTGIEPAARTIAVGLTPDGASIIGDSTLNLPVGNSTVRRTHAVRWLKSDNFAAQDLGTLPGYEYSVATGINDQGSVIVGIASQFDVLRASLGAVAEPATSGNVAFRWTQASGMVNLRDLLADAGLDMNGIDILGATAVSPDGSLIGVIATVPGQQPGQSVALLFCYVDDTLPNASCSSTGEGTNASVVNASWLMLLLDNHD